MFCRAARERERLAVLRLHPVVLVSQKSVRFCAFFWFGPVSVARQSMPRQSSTVLPMQCESCLHTSYRGVGVVYNNTTKSMTTFKNVHG